MLIVITGLCAAIVAIGAKLAGYSAGEKLGVGIPGLGPATTSAHLAIIAMLALAASRTDSSLWRLLAAIFLAATVIACFTRITIVAVGVGFAVIWLLSTTGIIRFIVPTIGLAAAPALFIFNDSFRQRMFKSGDNVSLSTMMADPSSAIEQVHGSGRFEAWDYVMTNFFGPNPFLGAGVGTTQHYFYTHRSTGLNAIHSEYIRLLAEVGIIGCLLFLIGFTIYARQLWVESKNAKSIEAKTYSKAALGGMIVYFTFMATDNAFDYVTACGIFVFTFIAMSHKATELDINDERELASVPISMVTSESIRKTSLIVNEQPRLFPQKRKYPILDKE
ncbi:MAG: O-antigen ligase family protein [Nitrospira sp.]|nr:O-antigen ligase family protein [Nitrospira sp.]